MSYVDRALPIAGWLAGYDRRWLRGDLIAGVAVTALVVPKNLGFAGIVGVPLQNGLDAAAAGAIIYALFCTSRQIRTGPSSWLAAVAGGVVLATALGGDQAAQLVAAIAIATGALFLLLGGEAGTQVFRDLSDRPGDETYPGVAVLRLDGGLFFATAEALAERVRGLADYGWRSAPSCSSSKGSTSSTPRKRRS